MKKIYHYLILAGFLIFFLGGSIYVAGQIVCLIIGQPELMISLEGITKVIFPAASISGLLCFLNQYLFTKKK
ncbi:hypothetical protein V3C10_20845 [[Clostridium] symbiosum]|uniref:hypothetical protein n=1 Tax=Clostridium symbiosum TaxID=1512 RepID=UPI001D0966F6|nr:hypothetical protein [[Clostridium] symbiosum]MCB6610629.1 hypothetical protein [[Clostridium] symbiosum]MCB6930925.1 hypothetical protein [[Clostridium] symbiosum]